mmetsp:Transcript_14087/g.20586  ORF Transcript_14087/g.20586 Transcript_14087/m.20586 type:complete len:96 (+) Transcript_14087:1026-1313(+)
MDALFMKHALNGSPFEGKTAPSVEHIYGLGDKENRMKDALMCFQLYVSKYASDIYITRRKKEIVRYFFDSFLVHFCNNNTKTILLKMKQNELLYL